MNEFIAAINWIVSSLLNGIFQLICTYWIMSIFTFIAILKCIAELVRNTREQQKERYIIMFIHAIATVLQFEPPAAPTMTSLLGDLGSVVTQSFTWIASVASTITTTPLLLLTTGFLCLGACVGLFSRLLVKC